MYIWETTSPDEMDQVGKIIASQLLPGDTLLLHGPLGAGKTTLSKSIIHSLTGIDPSLIDSPTFTYVNEYSDAIFHFDLYRLKQSNEFYELGLDEYFHKDSICLVEWPERCEGVFPEKYYRLRIMYKKEGGRTITLERS